MEELASCNRPGVAAGDARRDCRDRGGRSEGVAGPPFWSDGGVRIVQRLGQQITKGQREGPAQGSESKTMLDELARTTVLRGRHPDDRALQTERFLGGVEGDLQRRARRDDLGEAEQQPPPTDIPGPSLKGGPFLPFRPARHRKFQGQADAGMTHLAFGKEQVPQGRKLITADQGEGHAVGDDSSRGKRIPGPGHPPFHLYGTSVRLKAEAERYLGPEALRQVHAGTPFAQIPRPADAGAGRGASEWPVQERELNQVPGELSLHRPRVHPATPSEPAVKLFSSRRMERAMGDLVARIARRGKEKF